MQFGLEPHNNPLTYFCYFLFWARIGSWGYILALMTHISVLTNATLIAFQSNWMETHVFKKILWVQKPAPAPDSIDFALLAVRLLFIFFYEVDSQKPQNELLAKGQAIPAALKVHKVNGFFFFF